MSLSSKIHGIVHKTAYNKCHDGIFNMFNKHMLNFPNNKDKTAEVRLGKTQFPTVYPTVYLPK